VLGQAYAQLQQRLAQGQPGCLGAYAATDEAEFFAVATEVFFERPRALADEHPALYRVLAGYYGLQPLHWQPG
jgi:Mlc titration factor MtfA (ptsG expression regulator)